MRNYGTVTKLHISPQKEKREKANKEDKGSPLEGLKGKAWETNPSITAIDCVENVGIIGDGNAKGGDRQVTLMDDSVREWIRQQPTKGLCSSRFKANITIKDLNPLKLYQGALLKVGNTVLEITFINKKCYGEGCKLYSEKQICPIPSGCYFAKVVRGGQVKVADQCKIEKG